MARGLTFHLRVPSIHTCKSRRVTDGRGPACFRYRRSGPPCSLHFGLVMPTEAEAAFLRELVSMGFSEELSHRAVEATGGQSLSSALDWLTTSFRPEPLLHLDRASSASETEHQLLAAAIQESLQADASSAAAGLTVRTPSASHQHRANNRNTKLQSRAS